MDCWNLLLNSGAWVEELHKFLMENCLVDVNFFGKRTEEITAGAYFVSVTEIISNCQHVSNGILFIVNNYVLGLLWGNQCFFVFDSYTNDKNDNISSAGTAALLKFNTCHH